MSPPPHDRPSGTPLRPRRARAAPALASAGVHLALGAALALWGLPAPADAAPRVAVRPATVMRESGGPDGMPPPAPVVLEPPLPPPPPEAAARPEPLDRPAAPLAPLPEPRAATTWPARRAEPAPHSATVLAPTPSADNAPPEYPLASRRAREEGTVVVELAIDVDGSVLEALVGQTSGHPELDEAALVAARGWRFEAAREDGVAVAGHLRLPIVFRLSG